ncbi:hypothetical protein hairong_153 [Pseudomonas phage hairong]|nr:hypothetical protein hairong_153 [Pseudomonas phage hairong]
MSRPVLLALSDTHKICHYFYGKWPNQIEVAVFAYKRTIFIRDGKDVNRLLVCPVRRVSHPFPGSGDHDEVDRDGIDFSYETIGLFYGFDMPNTGWGGDC